MSRMPPPPPGRRGTRSSGARKPTAVGDLALVLLGESGRSGALGGVYTLAAAAVPYISSFRFSTSLII